MAIESLKLKEAREKLNKFLKKKETEAPQTKREKNKLKRRNTRITNKVERKYDAEDLGTDKSEARAAARTKEGLAMDKRRARGKQFFKDLALAAAGSGDTYSIRERKPNPMSEGGIEGSTNKSILAQQPGYEKDMSYKNTNKVSDGSVSDPQGKENMIQQASIDKLTQNEFEYDKGTSGLLKREEDSNPSAFMRKEYMKNKGY